MLALLNSSSRFALQAFLLVALFCYVGFANEFVEADENSDKSAAKIKVLIVDGQNNHGDWPKITAMLKQYLETNGKFTVDVERSKFTWKGDEWLKEFSLDDKEYKNSGKRAKTDPDFKPCLLYTSPSPRDRG